MSLIEQSMSNVCWTKYFTGENMSKRGLIVIRLLNSMRANSWGGKVY